MSQIYVELNEFNELGKTFSDISEAIFQANNDFQEAVRGIDWNIKSKNGIDGSAKNISSKLEDCRVTSRNFSNFVNTTYAKYLALENYDIRMVGIGDVTPYYPKESFPTREQPPKKNFTVTKNIEEPKTQFNVLEYFKNLYSIVSKYVLSKIDNVLNWAKAIIEKNGGTTGQLAIVADVIGFVETIIDMYHDKDELRIDEIILNILSEIVGLLDDVYDKLLKKYKQSPILNGISNIIAAINDLIKVIMTGVNDGLAAALSSLDGLIEDIGAVVRDFVDPGTRAIIYGVCTAATFLTRTVGDCLAYAKDGFDGKDFLHALGNGTVSALGTLCKLLTRGAVDFNMDAEKGVFVWDEDLEV